MVRASFAFAVGFMLIVAPNLSSAAQEQIPAYVTAAVNDAGRSAAEREADAVRQPADTVTFSTMKPGDVVADFLPGRGYYTRIFSKVVGTEGKVYAIVPQENLERRATAADAVNAIAVDAGYSNVEVASPSMAAFTTPEPVDIVWTSDNYHDVRNQGDAEAILPLNQAIFDSLKPGGVYFVVDHRAADGTGAEEKRENHRIDRETLISDITRAGFVLDAESDALARPEEDLSTHSSFASSQLILRFRKPQ
jgi:predicted methyltransferase